jgi:hypothetical protein
MLAARTLVMKFRQRQAVKTHTKQIKVAGLQAHTARYSYAHTTSCFCKSACCWQAAFASDDSKNTPSDTDRHSPSFNHDEYLMYSSRPVLATV